jgi:hypothetical protein
VSPGWLDARRLQGRRIVRPAGRDAGGDTSDSQETRDEESAAGQDGRLRRAVSAPHGIGRVTYRIIRAESRWVFGHS